MALLSDYFLSHSMKEAADAARLFLSQLGLPEPEDHDFHISRDGDHGALVFLTPIGCTLRFLPSYVPVFDHPRILRPLLTRTFETMRAALYPGVSTPFQGSDYSVWYDHYVVIESELAAAGIKINDINSHNGGVLPPPFDDYYLCIDPAGLKAMAHAPRSGLRIFDPQNEVFGGLRALFGRAWPGDALMPSPVILQRAWQECRAMKAGGILVANWENVDYEGTQSAACRYASKLEHAF